MNENRYFFDCDTDTTQFAGLPEDAVDETVVVPTLPLELELALTPEEKLAFYTS